MYSDVHVINAKTTLLILSLATITYMFWRRKFRRQRTSKLPTKWRQVGQIQKLIIYPLKSGRYLDLQKGLCNVRGLEEYSKHGKLSLRDRIFVVFNEETGVNVTAKSNPTMLLMKVSAESKDVVSFSHPSEDKLYVTVPRSDSEKRTCLMWQNETVEATDCGDEAAEWFSRLLSKKDSEFRLGYFIPSPDKLRSVETAPFNKYAEVFKEMKSEYMGAFSYLSSYLLLSSSSLSDLNVRASQPTSAYNFRPNIVVDGSVPYEEDSWNWIKIGNDVILKNFKPCTRCYITTLDPETALPMSNSEPICTLRKYRQLNDPMEINVEGLCPTFGIYVGLHQCGTVEIGDPVYVNIE